MSAIYDFTEKTAPATTDELEIQEAANGTSKKITIANLFSKPPAIGGTTPKAGSFTTVDAARVDATGDITGDDVVANTHMRVGSDITVSGFYKFAHTDETISAGIIVPTKTVTRLAPESGTTDTLTGTTGVYNGFPLLILSNKNIGDTITVQDGASFILAGGADFVMDTIRDRLVLMRDSAAGGWIELTRSNNS